MPSIARRKRKKAPVVAKKAPVVAKKAPAKKPKKRKSTA